MRPRLEAPQIVRDGSLPWRAIEPQGDTMEITDQSDNPLVTLRTTHAGTR